jgi:hypothetical protein
MNIGALIAVVLFAAALLFVFSVLYIGAAGSRDRGELDQEGIGLLRWALLGHLAIFLILGMTAFLT